jgi:hypothetical protein
MSSRHADMLRRLVHARDERVLAAGDRLGDHNGNIVGRLDDEDLECDVERNEAADGKSELRGACRAAVCEQVILVSDVTVPALSAWKVT